MYSRPSSYPYPSSFKNIKDVEEYQKKLYASLMENDRAGEFYRDRATDADLKALVKRPEWYGAKRDGVTNDSVAIQAAITAAGENGCVLFSDGTYLVTTTVNLPATNLTLLGSGTAVLDTSGTNSILKQTNHGALIRIEGIKFTGGGYGIEFDCADETEEYYEYAISNCTFSMDTGVYGVYMVGAREGTIDKCYFITGNGIYRSHSNVCVIDKCIFKSTQDQIGTAIYENGDAVAYSCGTNVKGCVIMGYDIPLKIVESDDCHIEGNVIDYNNHGIQLLGQDTGSITGNYLGTLGGSGDVNPAIELNLNAAVITQNIVISGNKIVGHSAQTTYDCIALTSTNQVYIANNNIGFYTRYGINYNGCTYLNIIGNGIIPKGSTMAATPYGVIATSDDSSNIMAFNNFVTYGSSTTWIQKWMNTGDVSSSGTTPISFSDEDASVSANGLVASNTAYYYPFLHLSKWAGTFSSPADVSAGHYMGGVVFYGYKDAAERLSAGITSEVVSVDTNIVEGQISMVCVDSAGTPQTPVIVQSDNIAVTGDINVTGVYKVDGVQVVGPRVVDARIDDTINSGDATTDGVIDAIRDALIAHGIIAAA